MATKILTNPINKVLIFSILCFSSACQKQKTISLGSLLRNMTNREVLCRFPDPLYTSAQFSSYDRSTIDPGHKSWYANWDRSMFLGEETIHDRKEYIMFDSKGPGAVVRFWMTFGGDSPGHGILRIYLDNDSMPVISGKPRDILGGKSLTRYPFAASVPDNVDSMMRGHNLYLPVPYRIRCKITYESEAISNIGARKGGEAVYYNINYRTYSAETKVVSFSKEELERNNELIRFIADKLMEKKNLPDVSKTMFNKSINTILSNASANTTIQGEKAVNFLKIKIKASDYPQALRSVVLKISFDEANTVWCPVGDFFSTAYIPMQYRSWYSQVNTDSSMQAHWIMPFRERCEISLHNYSPETVTVIMETSLQEWKWDRRTMYFGAGWKNFGNLRTGNFKSNEGDGDPFDINYLQINGKGMYVGDALSVFNTVYAWWGEGDEKIYVDKDTFPSHIGTGTEDYYGYAWCRPETFTNHPFISQPSGNGNFTPGLTMNFRHRNLDAIPFQTSLKVDMEMWHWTRALINFTPVCYFYLMPESKTNCSKDSSEVMKKVTLSRKQLVDPKIHQGKIEGENLILIKKEGGDFHYKNTRNPLWSNFTLLYWENSTKNEYLELGFFSETEGDFSFILNLVRNKNSGKFEILMNNEILSQNLDLFAENEITGELHLGKASIKKGLNILVIKTINNLN